MKYYFITIVKIYYQSIYSHMSIVALVCFQMLAKFAEDDRIEQMNAQKRRMRQLEHTRAVERLIEERRAQLQNDKVCSSYFYNSLFNFFLTTY